jgi:hypothetical protein
MNEWTEDSTADSGDWITTVAAQLKGEKGFGLASFLRYFFDETYPTGLWDVTDTKRTNDINSTSTPDEIIETQNRIIMFDWIELMKNLKEKFATDNIFCDCNSATGSGKCDEARVNPECNLWLQEKVSKDHDAMIGTCSAQNDKTNEDEYAMLKKSSDAVKRWKKHKHLLERIQNTQNFETLAKKIREAFVRGEQIDKKIEEYMNSVLGMEKVQADIDDRTDRLKIITNSGMPPFKDPNNPIFNSVVPVPL